MSVESSDDYKKWAKSRDAVKHYQHRRFSRWVTVMKALIQYKVRKRDNT